MNIINECVKSFKHIPYTFKHYLMMCELQKQYIGYVKYPFHDLDKLFMYLFFPFLGVNKISKIHKKYNKHHIVEYKDFDKCNYEEAILDWESAHYTKPDKPLTALEITNLKWTNSKHYPFLLNELRKFKLYND